MKEGTRKKRGGKRKSKNKEFMDAALDAFIRDQALRKWRDVEDHKEGAELEMKQALEASDFLEKTLYRDIWRHWWQVEVLNKFPNVDSLFASIEAAVRGAVLEEREQRVAQKEELLEDSLTYKAFIARQMDNLLFEAGGETEEFEEEI